MPAMWTVKTKTSHWAKTTVIYVLNICSLWNNIKGVVVSKTSSVWCAENKHVSCSWMVYWKEGKTLKVTSVLCTKPIQTWRQSRADVCHELISLYNKQKWSLLNPDPFPVQSAGSLHYTAFFCRMMCNIWCVRRITALIRCGRDLIHACMCKHLGFLRMFSAFWISSVFKWLQRHRIYSENKTM